MDRQPQDAGIPQALLDDAWRLMERSIVNFRGTPVGTVAAGDCTSEVLNYDQVFTRDFAVSAMAFLLRGEFQIVRNFLATMTDLQQREKHMDCFVPGKGLMPASFAVVEKDGEEQIVPDFGEHAIARVAPMDSGFWWLYILRAYVQASGDQELARSQPIQDSVCLILELALTTRFDMFPTLLVPDGCYMIDRRMGVYGYPFDMQALFFLGLLAAFEILPEESPYRAAVSERIGHLTYHLRTYYWANVHQIKAIKRYEVEEYGTNAVNAFNVYPETIPSWLMPWLPESAGYFLGNVGPGRIDFRYFAQGNLLSVLCGLATEEQSHAILNLYEARWDDLIGKAPLKLCFPALEGRDWEVITGFDVKNTPWSYHNAGNWPFLMWLFAAAAKRMDRPHLAQRALITAASRLAGDEWPEYYDWSDGQSIGKEARKYQTWTIAGLLAAHELLQEERKIGLVTFPEEHALVCSLKLDS